MKPSDYHDLFAKIRTSGGDCLGNGTVLGAWLAGHPELDPRLARQATPGFCAPMPSIDGNPPVYRNRPFFDARRIEKS